MNSHIVFRDVVIAVAKVVFGIPPADRKNFNESLIPSKSPPKGLDASLNAWHKYLNKIEDELHAINADYRQLDLVLADAKKTHKKSILFTCGYVRDKIMSGQQMPKFIAAMEARLGEL